MKAPIARAPINCRTLGPEDSMAAALTEVAPGELPAVAAVAVVEVIAEVVVRTAVEVGMTLLEVAAMTELVEETARGLLATISENEEGVAITSEKEKVGTMSMVVALETGPLQATPVKQHP